MIWKQKPRPPSPLGGSGPARHWNIPRVGHGPRKQPLRPPGAKFKLPAASGMGTDTRIGLVTAGLDPPAEGQLAHGHAGWLGARPDAPQSEYSAPHCHWQHSPDFVHADSSSVRRSMETGSILTAASKRAQILLDLVPECGDRHQVFGKLPLAALLDEVQKPSVIEKKLRQDLRTLRSETGLTPATSAPGLGSPLPHLHRDWARPSHICTGTALTPATSAPGLRSPLPHVHR
jgi:hypothetical protein